MGSRLPFRDAIKSKSKMGIKAMTEKRKTRRRDRLNVTLGPDAIEKRHHHTCFFSHEPSSRTSIQPNLAKVYCLQTWRWTRGYLIVF